MKKAILYIILTVSGLILINTIMRSCNNTTNVIQLSISKKEPHKISIVNSNITWLMEVESRK